MKGSHRWDLLGQVHLLRNCLLSTQRALLIHILHLLAEIGLLVDQADQTIFDL